ACPSTRNFDACGNGDEQQALKTDSSRPSIRSTRSSTEYSEVQPKADHTSACCRSPSTTVVCPYDNASTAASSTDRVVAPTPPLAPTTPIIFAPLNLGLRA